MCDLRVAIQGFHILSINNIFFFRTNNVLMYQIKHTGNCITYW
jgi:hypothetical protein